jgi:hypothetical protein
MLDTVQFFPPEIVNVSMLDELFFLLKSCTYTNASHAHPANEQDLLNDPVKVLIKKRLSEAILTL